MATDFIAEQLKLPQRTLFPLLLFVWLMLLWNLGDFGLLEDNDARFFEISNAMAQSGDWLIPRLNGIVHFHKPPLTFWAVGSSLKLFGTSTWAGRLPVALASFLLLCCVRILKPDSTWGTLILLTSLEYWFLSRLVLTDMFLALTVGTAMACYWRSRSSEDRKWNLAFWFSLGLSFLTKGPVGPAILALTLVGFHAVGGTVDWKRLLHPSGLLVFLATLLPWYTLAWWKYPKLLSYLFFFQTVDRVATEVHGRGGPIWFYLPVILGGFFPWSASLWVTLPNAVRRGDPLDRFLLAWLLGPLLLFSLSGSKLPTYLLPLFPALALLTARALEKSETARKVAVSCSVALGALALALLFLLSDKLPVELVPARDYLLGAGLTTGAAAVVGFVLIKQGKPMKATASTGLGFALTLLILSGALGVTDRFYSSRALAEFIIKLEHGDDLLVAEYRDHLHGLPVYLKRRIVQISYPRETQFEKDDEFKSYLFKDIQSFQNFAGKRPFLLVLSESDYTPNQFPNFEAHRVGQWYVLDSRKALTQ